MTHVVQQGKLDVEAFKHMTAMVVFYLNDADIAIGNGDSTRAQIALDHADRVLKIISTEHRAWMTSGGTDR